MNNAQLQLVQLRTQLHDIRQAMKSGKVTHEDGAKEYWKRAQWIMGWRHVEGPDLPKPSPQKEFPL